MALSFVDKRATTLSDHEHEQKLQPPTLKGSEEHMLWVFPVSNLKIIPEDI